MEYHMILHVVGSVILNALIRVEHHLKRIRGLHFYCIQ
jgi:hypothetical protein